MEIRVTVNRMIVKTFLMLIIRQYRWCISKNNPTFFLPYFN